MSPTPEEVINELAMSTSFSVHIVVEGTTDQRLLLQSLPKSLLANVIPAGSCEAALEVAKEYQHHPAHPKLRLVVFVDRDYQVAINNIDKLPNVVVTELRDIECMMFDSECFERVTSEFVSEQKLTKARHTLASIKKKMAEVTAEVGCVRYASQSLKWNVSFKALNYDKFVTWSDITIDKGRFIRHVNGAQTLAAAGDRQTPKHLNVGDYDRARVLADQCPVLSSPLLRARGHDLIALLFLGLRKGWGNKAANDLTPDLLEKTFRIAFPDVFRNTPTYAAILDSL